MSRRQPPTTPVRPNIPTFAEVLDQAAQQIEAAWAQSQNPTSISIGLRQLAALYDHLRSLGLHDLAMPRQIHGLHLVILLHQVDRCNIEVSA